MKIQYCSDLHLEFKENKEFLKANPLRPVGDILILAGDIVPFAVMRKHADFFDYVSDHFKFTYWLPGNHEYYRGDISLRSVSFIENIRDNVFLLNNQIINLNGLNLVLSTLWTKLNPWNQLTIQQNLSDFHAIRYKNEVFWPDQYNQLHEECKTFLTTALAERDSAKTVVVSHHIPTFLNYPKKYKGDILNEAFAVELHDLVEKSAIDFWIFGHHHQNVPVFEIGNTQLLTNQLGYVKYNEHVLFNPDKFIETNDISH